MNMKGNPAQQESKKTLFPSAAHCQLRSIVSNLFDVFSHAVYEPKGGVPVYESSYGAGDLILGDEKNIQALALFEFKTSEILFTQDKLQSICNKLRAKHSFSPAIQDLMQWTGKLPESILNEFKMNLKSKYWHEVYNYQRRSINDSTPIIIMTSHLGNSFSLYIQNNHNEKISRVMSEFNGFELPYNDFLIFCSLTCIELIKIYKSGLTKDDLLLTIANCWCNQLSKPLDYDEVSKVLIDANLPLITFPVLNELINGYDLHTVNQLQKEHEIIYSKFDQLEDLQAITQEKLTKSIEVSFELSETIKDLEEKLVEADSFKANLIQMFKPVLEND